MLRDEIKDDKYYADYLALCDKRMKRFIGLLPRLDSENTFGIKGCYITISDFYHDKIVAMYSYSNKIEEIKKEFYEYMKYFVEAVDETSGYYRILDALSLSVLLEYDDVALLNQILDKSKMHDCLLNTLINWLGADLPESSKNLYCTWYIKFLQVEPEKRSGFLKSYLKNEWYHSHRDAAWYDSHKSKVNTYVGYWSFEVGAIAKIFNIKDDTDWPYYPYDLVHTEKKHGILNDVEEKSNDAGLQP